MTATYAITAEDITAFWERCTAGTRLTCLANTYNHRAPGTTGIVTKAGKTYVRITEANGRHFHIDRPRRMRDVLALTDDTITYRIFPAAAGEGYNHSATWTLASSPEQEHRT